MYKDSVEFEYKGKKYTFKTELNKMIHPTIQIWWYEPLEPMFFGNVLDAKTIAKNIRKYNKGEYKLPEMRFR